MSDDPSELTFWRGLKGEFAGKKLEGVTFTASTTKAEGRRVNDIDDFFGDWYVDLNADDDFVRFPTSEELDQLVAEGLIVELTPEPRPHTAVAGRARVMIYDGTGGGFADRNDGHDSIYQQVMDPWPWAAPPIPGVAMGLGGNLLAIDKVFLDDDGTTVVQLAADKLDQVDMWHEGLLAQGYKLVRESTD